VGVKSEIIRGCKRGINACLHDKPASKGEWRSLGGEKLHESDLEMVSPLGQSLTARLLAVSHKRTKSPPAPACMRYSVVLS